MTFVYAFRCADRHMVKIGSGNPAQRMKELSVTEDLQWLFAMPGGKTQEDLIHRHFERYHVRREMFRYEGRLKAWIEEMRRRPGAALSKDGLDAAYATPGWLPWETKALPPIDQQQALALGVVSERKKREVPDFKPNLAQLSSGSDDWYTPPLYVDAARRVLDGTIDLDPASCALANKMVRAERIYTQMEDGLQHEWYGRVWMNPPYGGTQRLFVAHLLAEYERGHVTAAVALLNANVTDTEWFQPLWEHMLCFTHHRIGFYGPDGAGNGVKSGTVGTVFAYLGEERERFAYEFGVFGAIVEARPPLMNRPEFRELAANRNGSGA
jgi:hypothetical protein